MNWERNKVFIVGAKRGFQWWGLKRSRREDAFSVSLSFSLRWLRFWSTLPKQIPSYSTSEEPIRTFHTLLVFACIFHLVLPHFSSVCTLCLCIELLWHFQFRSIAISDDYNVFKFPQLSHVETTVGQTCMWGVELTCVYMHAMHIIYVCEG